MKSYRPWAPLQPYLLPPSPTEWLPSEHIVYFVLAVVEQLDLSAIEQAIAAKDPRGERPYSPRMMVALLLYGYCIGVFSSRRLARATYDDVGFRVLAADSHPHFTTINDFRLTHGEALGGLFLQGLRLCERAGLVQLGHVSLDGAKLQANASKHKAMSYKRMQEEESRLRAEIEAMMRRADEIDRAEDALYGTGRDPWWDMPEELKHRESRLARILAAKEELEREAAAERANQLREQQQALEAKAADRAVAPNKRKEAATLAAKRAQQALLLDPPNGDDSDDGDDHDEPGAPAGDLPRHHVATTADGKPAPKAQRNFTDPDSRIMAKSGAFMQAYNAHIAVDGAHQIIVAQAVTNQCPDVEHLAPVIERTKDGLGRYPDRVTADSGYYSSENVEYCEKRGIDPYICVGRTKHDGSLTFAASAPPGPTRDRMAAKLTTHTGRAVYALRKETVEPVFGQIKEARRFRRFSVRGLAKVRWEWGLVCLAHNLLKLFRTLWTDAAAAAALAEAETATATAAA